jgi:hypothetical protein
MDMRKDSHTVKLPPLKTKRIVPEMEKEGFGL